MVPRIIVSVSRIISEWIIFIFLYLQLFIFLQKFSDLVKSKFPRQFAWVSMLTTMLVLNMLSSYLVGICVVLQYIPDTIMSGDGDNWLIDQWHNIVKEEIDGTLTVAQLHAFDPSSYDIVHRYGRPYYLRARSEDYDLGDRINPHASFVRNYPFGMVVKVDPAANLSLDDLPGDKVRALALRYSVLLFRGLVEPDRECFRRLARGLGQVVWVMKPSNA